MSPDASAPRVVNRFFEFCLLGMLVSGYLAVVATGYLDWPTAALTLAGICLRVVMTAGLVRFELSSRSVAALAVAYIGFFPLDYFYLSGSFLSATVHMVFFLAVLKLLTARSARDYGYLKLIAVLELIAAAILSAGLSFLAFLALFVFFAIATFASGEVRRSSSAQTMVSRAGLVAFSRRLWALSGFLFLGILGMTAGLFFVLPRTARAALERFPLRSHSVLSGFSNVVSLGDIGEIKQSSIPVMHIRSYQEDGFLQVKWRGMALAEFDGTTWFNPPGQEQTVRVEGGMYRPPAPDLRPGTERHRRRTLAYQVHVNPIASETLFFAGTPETISIDVPFLRASRGGAYRVWPPRLAAGGISYSVYGFMDLSRVETADSVPALPSYMRAELLRLPVLDVRIPRLARQMAGASEIDFERARAIEDHLRHDYGYTLELPANHVADPLAYFLFDRKKGHCEYFASAMAVMLRTLGIPARVVTGFQSGVYNPMTGWQLIRASDAHSWVEAWLDGRGWTTFDPTPPDPTAGNSTSMLSRLSLLSDAAEQVWQDWVVGYDQDRQIALASRMQQSGRHFRFPDLRAWAAGFRDAAESSVRYLWWVVGLALAIGAGVLFGPQIQSWWHTRSQMQRLKRGQGRASDATVLYQRMLVSLERRGFRKPPWLTPDEFTHVLPASNVSRLVEQATEAYNRFRFGGETEAASQMVQVLEQIESL